MTSSSQLSDVLHVLLHMAEADGPVTSEALAKVMQTHPVVLRRLMTGLRDAGFVCSAKGHGGGWMLGVPLERLSLRDVHEALGGPALVSLGFRSDHSQCLVAQAVNDTLGGVIREAESLLLKRLGSVTLAALAQDFHRRMELRGPAAHSHEGHHHEV